VSWCVARGSISGRIPGASALGGSTRLLVQHVVSHAHDVRRGSVAGRACGWPQRRAGPAGGWHGMWASTAVPTALLEESPAFWPERGDRAGITATLGNPGLLTTPQGGYARAMVLEEDLAGERDLEDCHGAGQPRACPHPLTLLDLGQWCARICPRSCRRPSPTHRRRPRWSWPPGSRILPQAAMERAARSLNCQLLILDEWAHQEYGQAICEASAVTARSPARRRHGARPRGGPRRDAEEVGVRPLGSGSRCRRRGGTGRPRHVRAMLLASPSKRWLRATA
jgi:hypothetical protein